MASPGALVEIFSREVKIKGIQSAEIASKFCNIKLKEDKNEKNGS
jgi:hypothetical protein